MASEEGGHGDVFVEGFPVESAAVDAELFALLRCGAEEAGGPGEGTPRVRPSLRSTTCCRRRSGLSGKRF
jgi:hypothetical protein